MASLLNTPAPLSSEVSMTVQLLALTLLVIAFIIVKRRNHMGHGAIMFTAAVMNVGSILAVMIPAALRLNETSVTSFNFILRTHALLGLVIVAISVYILVEWRFQKPGPTCFQRKHWMLGLSLFWMTQVIIGMIFFMQLYPY